VYLAGSCSIKVIKGSMLDRIEVCKWDGEKIIVDENLKAEVIVEEEKRRIIEIKKIEIIIERQMQRQKEIEQQEIELEQQAMQRAVSEGLLSAEGNLVK